MKITKLYSGFELAEGPLYINSANYLVWVDIEGYTIHYYNELTQKKEYFSFDAHVGCVVWYKENIVVCAVGQSLVYFDLKVKVIIKTIRIFDDKRLRFNDGKCDKYGNLWIGTMAIYYDYETSKNLGSLYCIKNDVVIKEYKNFSIPNGLDWIDNYFFHIDTADNTLYRYEVIDECVLKNKIAFISDFEASPDGMTIDKDHNFWVALWGGKKVVCYSYKTQKIIEELQFEDPFISCVTFGGEKYNTLFITSAKNKNNKGSLYKVETNYIGKAPNKYKGNLNV